MKIVRIICLLVIAIILVLALLDIITNKYVLGISYFILSIIIFNLTWKKKEINSNFNS